MISILKVIHYFWLMFFKIQKNVSKNLSVRSCKNSFNSWISMASSFKKTEVKLELLTDVHMLLMVEKVIRGGICNAIHQYTKDNNKYMKDYDKNKESFHLKYWDVNNLY